MKKLEELGISPMPWSKWFPNLVEDGDGKYVAEVYPFWTEDSKNANRKLIIAAPELYEALQLCLSEMCKLCNENADRPCIDMCEVCRIGRAALEKAGGEE